MAGSIEQAREFGANISLGEKREKLFDLKSLSAPFLKLFSESKEKLADKTNTVLSMGFREIEDLIIRTKEMDMKSLASEALWNMFGLPQSLIAIPVFDFLTSQALEDNKKLRQIIEKVMVVLAEMFETIEYEVQEFHEKEIDVAGVNQKENEQGVEDVLLIAENQVYIETDFRGKEAVENRTEDSATIFGERAKVSKNEIENLEDSKGRWTKFMENLYEKFNYFNIAKKESSGLIYDSSQAIPVTAADIA